MLDGKIAFIGGGAMAEAIIKGLLTQAVATPTQLTASDPVAARRDFLQAEYSIRTATDNAETVRDASVIVLAVKPQVFERVAEGLRDQLDSEALVISIMAGRDDGDDSARAEPCPRGAHHAQHARPD